MRIKLGIPLDLFSLLCETDISVLLPGGATASLSNLRSYNLQAMCSGKKTVITHVTADSREAMAEDLFISLAKDEHEASRHIREALDAGAYVLRNNISPSGDLTPFEKLARYYKSRLPRLLHTVAITGSTGKTTTKEFTRALFESKYTTHATVGNMNNEVGVPLTILQAPEETEALILEFGMNERGEIGRLSHTATPNVAVITNIGSAHIGRLGSRKAIREAKLEITEGMPEGGLLITKASDGLPSPSRNIGHKTYGLSQGSADVCLSPLGNGKYTVGADGSSEEVTFFSDAPHILEDLCASLSASYYAGISLRELSFAASSLDEGLLRYKRIKVGNLLIIDDAYNSSLESVKASLLELSKYEGGVRSALIGEILEAGSFSERVHFEVGRLAAGSVDKLYIVGGTAEAIKKGAMSAGLREDRIFILGDADNIAEVAQSIYHLASSGECLLIKASNRIGLHKFRQEYERIVKNAE